jgi:hypothetical protein
MIDARSAYDSHHLDWFQLQGPCAIAGTLGVCGPRNRRLVLHFRDSLEQASQNSILVIGM